MAWMRMGVDSVQYHRETVLGRADDNPGVALDYYASRGETPLVWGGSGARDLGVAGAVTEAQYDAIFGVGGARDPGSGTRLVHTKRPGVELVVAAHKSVALLGLVGRAEDMHAILDAEAEATLAYLDAWMITRDGRRGRSQTRVPTDAWSGRGPATPRLGRATPRPTTIFCALTSVALATKKGAGKRSTRRPCATSCMRPQLSAGWHRRPRRSSSDKPSRPTTGPPGNSAIGA